jgi:iron complex outermembrane receptor protein
MKPTKRIPSAAGRIAALAVLLVSCLGAAADEPALRGRVLDSASGQPLAGVRVRVTDPVRLETVTAADGTFRLSPVPRAALSLEASLIGYAAARLAIATEEIGTEHEIRLEERPLPGPEVEVTTTRAVERRSPVAFTELPKEEIEQRYWAQDVPMLLAETPGVYAYSDAGNGIGYSYVKIRGFSQRRVAVTINGIPLNDPMSHEVYWVDHPDLLASAENVQVQRGAGSALYGAGAVGGSINLETLRLPEERRVAVAYGAGSYATQRFSLEYDSGLLQNRYALSGRYSRILSNGYRDQSWSDLWSYYLAAARRDERVTTRLNLYGGPESVHLAYYGVDRSYLDGRVTGDAKEDRKYNPLEWRNETDNFFEPHYELLQDVKVSDRSSLTSALFYFPGEGYYDDFPWGPQTFESRHLPPWFETADDSLYPASYYQLDSLGMPERQPDGMYRVIASDMTQRLWAKNSHYGWIPRARVSHSRGELTVGGELRESVGRRWGEMTWAAAAPPGTEPNYVTYDYTGRVNTVSAFAQESWLLRPELRATGSLQWRHVRYAIGKDRYNHYDFSLDYSFLNPRVGLVWNPDGRWSLFGNYAHTQVEPLLSEIYRPDDPTSVPAFGTIDVENHVYEDPLVTPEKLNDYEAGVSFRKGSSSAKLTAYWLDFRDEIVPSGTIDALGVPITGNAGRSKHVGLELEGVVRHRSGLELSGNVSFSRNEFDEYLEYVYDYTAGAIVDTLDHGGNTIALFPDRMANVRLGYGRGGVRAGLTVVETGRQYLDNTEDNRMDPALRDAPGYQKKYIPEHAVLNADLSLDLAKVFGRQPLDARRLLLDLRVLNLTDLRYETSGYVYTEVPYFYPAAGRNAFVSLTAEF